MPGENDRSERQHPNPKIPQDYPGTAQADRGEPVTKLDTRTLDTHETLLRVWTEERDAPLELALTPTQVRQWEAQLDIERWRVDVVRTREQPDLDETVLVSIIGKAFHDPHAEACAAVNAHDSAIDTKQTVAGAVEDGYRPCNHCYEMDGWDPADLRQEVKLRGD